MNDVTNTCLLSIIVPVYNSEKYLRDCLDSLLLQNIPMEQYEIICVDDGATDSSPWILDEYAKKHANIRVIHKENGGVSSARNVGIDHANGEYVWFVDSDDVIMPNCLQKIGALLNKYRPEMIHFSYKVISEDYKLDSRIDCWSNESTVEIHDCDDIIGSLPSAFLAITCRKVLTENSIRFEEKIRYAEDSYFQHLVYLQLSIPVVVTNQQVYYYRIVGSSAMHNTSLANINRRTTDAITLAYLYDELIRNDLLLDFTKKRILTEQKKWNAVHVALLLLPKTALPYDTINKLRKIGAYPCRILWWSIRESKSKRQKLVLFRNCIVLRFRIAYWIYYHLVKFKKTREYE